MTQEQTDNLINHYFSLFTTIRHVTFEQFNLASLSSPHPDKDWRGVRDMMVSYGLIVIYDNGFNVTSFGSEVLRSGGWLAYLSEKKEEKQLTAELIKTSIVTNQSSITSNKVSIRTNKATIAILIVTVIISGIGAWISWLNYDFLKTHQEPSRRTIDSLSNKLLEKQNRTLQDLRDVLKREPADSLDKK